jgi:hypothetical protein
MRKPSRMRWVGFLAVAGAGLVSGCYYDPYGYYWWGSPYPYSYGWRYPYPPGYPYPPAPSPAPPNPQPPVPGPPQPLNEPVQRAPLPPAP